MSQKTLDFLVTAVDNFGDTGFALDLAESLLSRREDFSIRFFSDDRPLFEKLCAGVFHPKIAYRELREYETDTPSDTVVSFFDRKLPEGRFAAFPFSKKILQLSYLRFDADRSGRPGVGSMNATRYRIGNDEVVHLVPSPLEEGAGVVTGRSPLRKSGIGTEARPRTASAFFYPETRSKLEAVRRATPEIRFAEFGNPEAEIALPFLRFDEYAAALPFFEANVVRGENSAVKALLSGKPFLWDFYKESNGAHADKIEDFLDFLRPFFREPEAFEEYARALRSFNGELFDERAVRECGKILANPSDAVREAFSVAGRETTKRDLTETVLNEIEGR